MDLVTIALENAPSNWDDMEINDYQSARYILIDVPTLSDEYNDVVSGFSDKVTRVQRVQHATQLALYILSMGNRDQLGKEYYKKTGFHVVNENDLKTALRYPLDYRRYQYGREHVDGKQPVFHGNLMAAITYANSNAKNVIIACEVLSYSSYSISTKYQWDYLPLYVIFLA